MKTMTGVLTFLAALCVGLFLTGLAHAGLVQYWAFEETSGTISTANEVAGGNTGTMVNFTGNPWVTDTPTALAHSSGSLDFESTNTQSVNGGAIGLSSTSSSGGATVSMWIKPEDISDENRPFSQVNGSTNTGGATRLYEDGSFDVWGGSGIHYQKVVPTTTPPAIQTGNWYHVALTWSGNTVSAYVNGQFTGSGTSNFDYGSTLQFGIGAEYTGSFYGDTFDGLVDDVAVFDQSLNSYQIKSLSNGLAPSEALNNMYVVNVDLQSTSGVDYVGLGAAPDEPGNTYWNPLEGSSVTSVSVTDLTASDGISATPIDVSIWNVFDLTTQSTPLNDLQRDRAYTKGIGDTGNFKISGLDSGCGYDVYLFVGGAYATDYTIGGVTKTASAVTGDTGYPWIEGDDYVVFRGLTGLTEISGTFLGSAFGYYGVLSGIQIRQVPEPTSVGLLAIGLMGLIVVRRRRK